MTDFSIKARSGDARAGVLSPNGVKLETPHLFPVISFYGGGNESSLFGGGIYRTVKEFMVNDEDLVNDDYGDLFNGVMTSVSALTDFEISEEKMEFYLQKPIKEWEHFEGFDGVIFLDSGGFKIMTEGGLKGNDFEKDINQEDAYNHQRRMGGDIIVNLDHPILPDDNYNTRVEKAKKTAKNAKKFVEISEDFNGSRYLTVHGYHKSMLKTFFEQIDEEFDNEDLGEVFDGLALGSLVPKKNDYETLINSVRACREIMEEREIDHLPLHVLGISSSSIPILVLLGADTFDSASYLQSAFNGKYMTSLADSMPLDKARKDNFEDCDCRVCSDPDLRDKMKGNTEYQKDVLGPVAIHNMEVQKREIDLLREKIVEGEDHLRQHIENTLDGDKVKKFAYRAVNTSLGEYF